MIITESDRVELLVFTLPVHQGLLADLDPLSAADLVGELFDDYAARVTPIAERLRRVGLPERGQASASLDDTEGWQIWTARYARLVLAEESR